MSDQMTVTITGKDGVSRVFAEVTKSAGSMADALDKAGTDGAKGLESVGKGAEQAGRDLEGAGRSFNTFQQETESAAQNLDNLAASFDFLTQASLEQQRLTSGLAAAYGEAGDEMIAFSDHIQDVTKYSNDAAQQSLLLASSLSKNYGFAADETQMLLERTADLAQIYGYDLADAMQRTSSAMRGEGESAEALGLNLSDAAMQAAALDAGITNWNVPGALTEAEKAAFRFQVFMEQSAYATGEAAKAASGASGRIAQIGNAFQDVTQDVTSALGPTTAIAGALANVSSQAFSVIGGGAAIAGMFEKVGSSALVARAGTVALSAVLNPVGAVVLGIGAAAALVGGIWMKHRNDVKEAEAAYEELVGAIDATDDIVRNLNLEGKFELANVIKKELLEARTALDKFAVDMGEVDWFADAISEALQFGSGDELAGLMTDFIGKSFGEAIVNTAHDRQLADSMGNTIESIFNAIDPRVLADGIITGDEFRDIISRATVEQLEQLAPILEQAAADFWSSMELSSTDRKAIEDAWKPLFDLFSNPNIDTSKLDAEMDRLIDLFNSGKLSPEQLATEFNLLFDDITAGSNAFNILADDVESVSTVMIENARIMEHTRSQWDSLLSTIADVRLVDPQAAEDIRDLGYAFDDLYGRFQQTSYELDEVTGRFVSVTHTLSPTAEQVMQLDALWGSLNATIASGEFDNALLLAQVMQIISDTSTDLPTKIDQLYALTQFYAEMAEVIPAAEEAQNRWLDSTLGLIGTQTDVNEETEASVGIFGQFKGVMDDAAASTADAAKEAQDAAEAARELRQQWHEAGLALAGYDDIVSQLNLTGNGTGATQIAEDIGTATSALDNMFRVIVGNTDALMQQVEGVKTWADELIGAVGDVGQIDQLLADGVIGWDTYTEAQAAYNSIAQDTTEIQNNLLSIQAKQAPVIADLVSQQENYIESLARLPAEQQLIALGWMDATTAAQANEAMALAAAAANGEMGAMGKEAFAAYLQGAIALNPALEAILRDVGLINAQGEIDFGVAESTKSDIDILTEQIYQLVDVLDDGILNGSPLKISVDDDEVTQARTDLDDLDGTNATATATVETSVTGALANLFSQGRTMADLARDIAGGGGDGTAGASLTVDLAANDEASPAIEELQSLIGDVDGTSAEIVLEGDNSPALDAIDETDNELGAIDGNDATVIVLGDPDDAMNAITTVGRNLSALDGDSAKILIYGDESDAINAINRIAAYDGDVLATSYYNVVTRYSSVGSPTASRHGGIPGYAHGGMIPVELAEAGMELLHYANGGIAPVFDRGIYGVPAGTYVESAASARDTFEVASGGNQYVFNINAPVYGIDDLTNKVFAGIVASTQVANREQLLGQGVTA